MTTLLERNAAILLSRGEKELPSRSARYRCFTYKDSGTLRYWLGKNGAVRIGRTVSASYSARLHIPGTLWPDGNEPWFA